MDLQLKGKCALITGGSRGIGLGAARLLAREGCNLHLAARSAADLDAAKAQITAEHHVNVHCHALDLSVASNAVALARECRDVDFLVNNAGSIPQGTLDTLDDETWKKSWDLKVFGFIDITREIIDVLQPFDISVHGHLIVGTSGVVSFRSAGMI